MVAIRSIVLALFLAVTAQAFVVPRGTSAWTAPRALTIQHAVAAADVKTLRDASGAGMMKCKEALTECDGDMEKAQEWLRARGLASADKKADRATTEGLISTYVHTGSKLGVMVELNCETDFVAKGEKFTDLARSVAMQVAACPTVEFVNLDDISDDVKAAERAAEMNSEDLKGKPDNIKEKMVEGRIGKILKQKVLLEQPYVKDPSMTVEELIKSNIATLGENIKIARFVRFNLGETSSAEEPASE